MRIHAKDLVQSNWARRDTKLLMRHKMMSLLLLTILLNFTNVFTFMIQGDFASKFIKESKLFRCNNIVLEGKVSDCNVDFQSVNNAVKTFFQPLLQPLTSTTFFRYFRVDLESTCPFWQEDGQCIMEGCSVDICDEKEIPKIWKTIDNNNNNHNINDYDVYSNIKIDDNSESKENLHDMKKMSKIRFFFNTLLNLERGINRQKQFETLSLLSHYHQDHKKNEDYMKYLRETEDDNDDDDDDDDDDEWTDMTEAKIENCKNKKPHFDVKESHNYYTSDNKKIESKVDKKKHDDNSVYVNLVDNPETYTGYAGPSAHRVWQSIQKENCFGGIDDICFEKRIFYRLMSGLQSSISTHIASKYYYPDGKLGYNIKHFTNAVGRHIDRMNNLYFTFLFVLRAIVKVNESLTEYPYYTGNITDDKLVRNFMTKLVNNSFISRTKNNNELNYLNALDECRHGFDETILFQVPSNYVYNEKKILREEFRLRFRNVTRIMNCVTCEKCRVWGKLQILGIGTAIKLLLTPTNELNKVKLYRQEIIALINTLHQLATSIDFAASAHDVEFRENVQTCLAYFSVIALILIVVSYFIIWMKKKKKTN